MDKSRRTRNRTEDPLAILVEVTVESSHTSAPKDIELAAHTGQEMLVVAHDEQAALEVLESEDEGVDSFLVRGHYSLAWGMGS